MLLDWENSIEQAVKPLFRCSTKKDQQLSHSVQLVVAGADLLWEKSTADWLVADADSVWEKNTAGWLADKQAEYLETSLMWQVIISIDPFIIHIHLLHL